MSRLDEVRDRAEATTAGDWEVGLGWVYSEPPSGVMTDPLLRIDTVPANAEFIVHARADIEWLLTELERLHATLADRDTPLGYVVVRQVEEGTFPYPQYTLVEGSVWDERSLADQDCLDYQRDAADEAPHRRYFVAEVHEAGEPT